MKSFKTWLDESVKPRRSKSSKSPGRRAYLERKYSHSKEEKFKAQMPPMSDYDKEEHIQNHFKFDTIDKVVRSSHDPKAPIDLTRPLPDSVKALARAFVYHFEDGIRQQSEGLKYNHPPTFEKGRRQILAATHGMNKYIGEHHRNLMVDNNTRPVLKKLIQTEER